MLKIVRLLLLLLSSFGPSVITAAPIDIDFTQNNPNKEIVNKNYNYLEPTQSLSPLNFNVNTTQLHKLTKLEQWVKTNFGDHLFRYYAKLNYKNIRKNQHLNTKPSTFIFDYGLNTHLRLSQSLSNNPIAPDETRLVLSKLIKSPDGSIHTYFNNDQLKNVSMYNLDEINRLDLAYIEEELFYSKESGVSYSVDDTSEAVRTLTFYSLDLDDKTLIWAAMGLVGALLGIGIYARLHIN